MLTSFGDRIRDFFGRIISSIVAIIGVWFLKWALKNEGFFTRELEKAKGLLEADEITKQTKTTIIKQTELANGLFVSTVHIPLLEKIGGPYETMVFSADSHELETWHTKDAQQALADHARLSAKWSEQCSG